MGLLLDIQGLTVAYEARSGSITAIDHVNLELLQDEFLAVVGESGCGKSTLGLSVIGLLPKPPAKIVGGSIRYKDTDLLQLKGNRIREYRGTEIAMIFQEPLTSLSPVYKVGDQIAEAILVRELRKDGRATLESEIMQRTYKRNARQLRHGVRFRRRIPSDLKEEATRYLKLVRIPDPDQVLDRYPFELSGGMTQRVMIAMALSQEPALLVADEPTTALDVTTQAQVLKLMKELIRKVRTSILLVTHDLAVASQVADRVVVMYAGEIVEDADVRVLFSHPLHPYTSGLLSCIPSGYKSDSQLKPIAGSLPDLRELPVGCKFAPRCPQAMGICTIKRPQLIQQGKNQKVSCFLYDGQN
ncbi:MAG: ABC transporter ATP-binding protein [Candidatus Bathyarchaeia archaeon]